MTYLLTKSGMSHTPQGVDAAQVKNHWSIARKWRSSLPPTISQFLIYLFLSTLCPIYTSLCHVLQDCQMCGCIQHPCRQAYTRQTTARPTSLIIMLRDKSYLYPAGTTAATAWDSANLQTPYQSIYTKLQYGD